MSSYNHKDTFYCDPEKQERVRVTYNVRLTAPAWCEGVIKVEATSEEDAARLALKQCCDIDWDSDYDTSVCEVVGVECENPPAGTFLVGGERTINANLDALFEPEDEPTAAEEPIQRVNDGGDLCK